MPAARATASVSRLPHLAQRNFRSFSGRSPWPASMIASRSAGTLMVTGFAPDQHAEIARRGECCGRSGGDQL